MADYTVTVRDQADIDTLAEWAKDQFRPDPSDHLSFEIRKLLQQYRAAQTKTPRAMGGTRRGARQAA